MRTADDRDQARSRPAPTNVRFEPSVIAAARRLARADGVSLSAWVRRVVERELGRREGRCVTCGQEVPPHAD